MNGTRNIKDARHRLAFPSMMVAVGALLLSGCYYDDGYGYGPGYYPGAHYSHAKLKPKEKAYYGYGPHAGHPHGGPPGQVKKYYGGRKGHPHGGPPGQLKKGYY